MRLVHLAPILAIAALTALPASADVEARIGADFQKKLDKTYGVREADVLKESLIKQVQFAMTRKGQSPAKVVVTIEDAKPNRPTFEQLSDKPGLDPFLSISVGGAKVSGIAYDASGKEIGNLSYDWYETDITQETAATTWTDARNVFSRFARKFADKVG